jgi:predicted TPR repeat methyltransferase
MQSSQTQQAQVRSFFDQTDRYLSYRPHIVARQAILRKLLGEADAPQILDLGCGDGSLSLPLLSGENRATLVDLSEHMLECARESIPSALAGSVDLVRSDLGEFSSTQEYDLVLCIGVLAYVNSVAATVKKVSDCLRPGGRCVFQFTDAACGLGKFELWHAGMRGRFSTDRRFRMNAIRAAEFTDLCSQAGLDCEQTMRHWLMLPGMGRISPTRLLGYDRFVREHPFVSRFAPSTLLLCRKR